MEEGSAPAVLAREAHAAALLHQRRVRERLGASPVEGLLALEHPAAIGDELRHARVQAELLRIARDALPERAQPRQLHRGRYRLGPVHLRVGAPVDGVLVADQAERRAGLRAAGVEAAAG